MEHKMHLHHDPFCLIQEGKKTIEMRVNDEKRQLIHVGDSIEFSDRDTKDIILTEVVKIHHFSNFEELLKNLDKEALGYLKEDIPDPVDLEKYYSKEEQAKYGVVGIEIKLVKE